VSRVLLFAQAIVHRCFPLGLCLRLVGFTNKHLVLVFGVDFKCGELCESPICLGKCVLNYCMRLCYLCVLSILFSLMHG
jgi:hypothetical protein